jgi:predicted lipoprotein with Yx(FWY)xxD motif
MIRPHRHLLTASLGIPLALLALAACGSDSGSSASSAATRYGSAAAQTTSPAGTAAAATPGAPSSPAVGSTVPAGTFDVTVATTSLGTFLTDGQGNTLYLFTSDTPTASACTGGCASTWPAFALNATPKLGPALDAADFATINGPDGSPQSTFHGHPLYFYAGDTGPGDVNGQGIGGSWFVVGKDGNPIK